MRNRQSGQTDSHLYFTIGVLLFVAISFSVGHWLWLKLFLMNADTAVRRLGRGISPSIAVGQPVDSSVYRNFIAQEPRVGYVVIANYRSGYRHGLTNLNALQNGSNDLLEDLKEMGEEKMLSRLVQPGAGFPGEYLHVVSAAFVPSKGSTDVTPIGLLKVGFVVPGHVAGLPPFGRGFQTVIWVWWGVTGILCVALLAFGLIRKLTVSSSSEPIVLAEKRETEEKEQQADPDELSWLEEELEAEQKFFVDHEGKSWRVLFDGNDLSSWQEKGDAYTSEGEMVLRPWGSSMVCRLPLEEQNYVFRIYGRKVAGKDGFILLFPCEGHSLAWVIGGWGNQRSEVAGYANTSTECRIERNRWYQLDVRVGVEELEGWVDDVKVWTMARSNIKQSSPDVGFQSGLGVAAWNTMVRFRDARYQKL